MRKNRELTLEWPQQNRVKNGYLMQYCESDKAKKIDLSPNFWYFTVKDLKSDTKYTFELYDDDKQIGKIEAKTHPGLITLYSAQ